MNEQATGFTPLSTTPIEPTPTKTNNCIFQILAYRHAGGWVFDDPSVGLVKEPFVAGADDLIEHISEGADKVALTFSTIPFPGHTMSLVKTGGGKEIGTNYHCPEFEQELWLCPALNLYYPASPETIYVKFKALP